VCVYLSSQSTCIKVRFVCILPLMVFIFHKNENSISDMCVCVCLSSQSNSIKVRFFCILPLMVFIFHINENNISDS
jgi:formate/nitrite transporter FocA (FNT family)